MWNDRLPNAVSRPMEMPSQLHVLRMDVLTFYLWLELQSKAKGTYKYCMFIVHVTHTKFMCRLLFSHLIQDARDAVVVFFPHYPQGSTTVLFHCYSRGERKGKWMDGLLVISHCVLIGWACCMGLSPLDRVLLWFGSPFSVASITHTPQTTNVSSSQTLSYFPKLSSSFKVPHIKNSINRTIIICI